MNKGNKRYKDSAEVLSAVHQYGIVYTHAEFPEDSGLEQFPIHGPWSKGKGEAASLAATLIREEVTEELLPAIVKYIQSPSYENLTEIADGAIDSIYVLLQLLHVLDLPTNRLFAEVHFNNMSKLQFNAEGKLRRRADGKVLKPESYKPVDLFSIIMDHANDRCKRDRVYGAENWGGFPKVHISGLPQSADDL